MAHANRPFPENRLKIERHSYLFSMGTRRESSACSPSEKSGATEERATVDFEDASAFVYLRRFFFFSVPRELSSLRPQTPFGEMFATKGGSRVARIRCSSVHADVRIGAHDCGFLLFLGRKKTRHLLAPIAAILRGSLRILLSAVITIQRRCPHSASHMSSDSFGLKISSCTLITKPACRSRDASCFLPKLRSRKKILISGCWGVAKNLFNLRHF
jgi:hypothetical protein